MTYKAVTTAATAPFTAPSGYDCTYAYNLNSAPVAITRRGDDEGRRNVLVDDLALTYEGNRLVNVSDSGEEVLLEASGDFVDGATGSGEEYAYDANGNMVRDDNRGIKRIVYNCINQPSDIVVGKYENQKMHYDYAADGRKLATYASETMVRIIRDPVDPIIPEVPVIKDEISDSLLIGEFDPVVVGPIVRPINTPSIKLRREYVDNMEYVDGKLSRINTPYGYYNAADSLFYAYQTDRQGNIRVVYTARDNENWQEVWDDNPDDNPKVFYDVVQSTSYYPYGMPIAHGTGAGKNPYKFGGKEYETRFGLNLYDFVARGYDPALGIFLRPDPKARDFTQFNPYLYCAANPLAYIDPTGMDSYLLEEDGKITLTEKTDDEYDSLTAVKTGSNILLNKNILNSSESYTVLSKSESAGIKKDQLDIITSEEPLIDLFYFVSDNTNVEFSYMVSNKSDGRPVFRLGTSHEESRETCQSFINSKLFKDSETLRLAIHNHPNGNGSVSKADVLGYNLLSKSHPNHRSFIYRSGTSRNKVPLIPIWSGSPNRNIISETPIVGDWSKYYKKKAKNTILNPIR